MQYFAHTTDNPDKSDWELIETHLVEVAELSSLYAGKLGMGELGHICGILHDVGKFAERFQARLEDNSITGINHWSSGSKLAFDLGYPLAAFCIEGHHTGLPNLGELGQLLNCLANQVAYEKIMGFTEPHDSILNKFLNSGLKLPGEHVMGGKYDFLVSLQARMLFSCLIDADRTSTSNFSNKSKGLPIISQPDIPLNPNKALQILLDEISKHTSTSKLGLLRTEVLNDCLDAGEMAPGLFTLTVPTGGGKTLSSVAFSLKHAEKYNKTKIIYVIPFTTIIDQIGNVLQTDSDPNALCLKYDKHFGDEYILEHHSTLEVDNKNSQRYKIDSANWGGNPFIVTTTVQFFESLFSNHPSACRKLHNIPNSVIVFDEVQTLPTKLLKSLLTMVQLLVSEYKCTVVFCSATVPAFESVNLNSHWLPHEICKFPTNLSSILKRCNINCTDEVLTHSEVASKLAQYYQCLFVGNTKRNVMEVYNKLKSISPIGCYHLSTSMCATHRKKVISQIRLRLKNKLPCRVVSTQLIEAGVDVDFPYGIREYGPMDSIIQTAGRVNREGKLTDNNGELMLGNLDVIRLDDERSPRGAYQVNIKITQSFIKNTPDVDFHSPTVYKKYFKQMYSLVGQNIDPVFEASSNLQFKTVAEEAKIIENLTISVIVPYEDGKNHIHTIKQTKEIPKWMYRKLQIYSINVYETQLEKLLGDCVIEEVQCGNSSVYCLSNSNYDDNVGMNWKQLEISDYIL